LNTSNQILKFDYFKYIKPRIPLTYR